jgi:hypothetical protein
VAAYGTKNFWSKRADSLFHLTVVTGVGANGFAAPPLFGVPGQRCSRKMMDGCDIPGSSVTVAPKGFINARLFAKWLSHFQYAVPGTTKRLLILVFDGYSSHYNENIATKATCLDIIFDIK